MKLSKDKSINLTIIFVYFFAFILLALDIVAPKLIPWYIGLRKMENATEIYLFIFIYLGSLFGYALLYFLKKLLENLKKDQVFTEENTKLLSRVSISCGIVSIISLVGIFFYPPMVFMFVATGFMALLVRIIKNIMHQAYEMKSELDLTI